MLWTMRLVIFALALAFGLGFWLVLAYGQTPASQQAAHTNVNGRMNSNTSREATGAGAPGVVYDDSAATTHGNVNRDWTPLDPGAGAGPDGAEAAAPAVDWAEPGVANGQAVATRVTLRGEPNSSSNVVATLDMEEAEGGYSSVEILESTRDFLRVRFSANSDSEGGTRQKDYEGWVEWGAVVPHTSAVVLDTDSGEVVGRLALDYGVSLAAFSPDGKRAVFYASSAGGGHGDTQTVAYEVDAESYKVLRTLRTSADGGFAGFLYDGAGGDLHALAQTAHSTEHSFHTKLHPFRVKGDLIEPHGEALRPEGAGGLVISRDGLTGFNVRPAGGEAAAARVDVIDLKTLTVRNSFELTGGEGEGWPYEYGVNSDASEFYYRERADGGSVVVVDARTGGRLREIKPREASADAGHFWHNSVVGGSVLLKYWTETEEGTVGESNSVWLRPDGERVPAEKGIDNVIEAGGSIYAVNDAGTHLYKLDGEGRVKERLKIARPESVHRPDAGAEFTVMGLHASPGGKHVVIFFGIPDGC